jgi:hypothetical protein
VNFDVTIEIPKGAAEALAEIDDCRKRLADSEGGHP